MMRWFDQWFARKCRWAWENKDILETADIPNKKMYGTSQLIAVDDDSPPWQDGLRINIKKVIGGFVISFRVYDRRTDRSDERHYIITDEQDFNVELGKMITMESIRQT
jgi:hypothetical protein